MQQVVARKGLAQALRCDICRARYALPPGLALRESRRQRVDREARELWRRLVRSRAGPAVRAAATAAWCVTCLSGVQGSIAGLAAAPRVVLAARARPAAARPVLARFVASSALEPLLLTSTLDLNFPLETLLFYAGGWLLDAAARMAEVRHIYI
jgi:hypothetical protein